MTILCEQNQELATVLAAQIDGDVQTVSSLPGAAMALAADPAKALVVIGAEQDLEQSLQFCSALRLANLATGVILLRESPDAQLRERAIDHGVREVVPVNDTAAFALACRRVRASVTTNASGQPGQIITVFSAKGGCGKTTMATNLAVALNAGRSRRVCLVDLDLGFGDVASTLRLDPARTLADAASLDLRDTTVDASEFITPFRPGLDCILAPVGPGEAQRVPATLIGELLPLLSAEYDYVVVDTPAQFSQHVLAALDNSDHHVLLTTPEVPTLKSLRLTLDTLDMLSYRNKSRSIVFNRCDSRVGLAGDDVERLLKTPIACWIPSSWDVPASINRGVPLVAAQPGHAVSAAIRRFAEERLVVPQLAVRRRTDSAERRRRGLT